MITVPGVACSHSTTSAEPTPGCGLNACPAIVPEGCSFLIARVFLSAVFAAVLLTVRNSLGLRRTSSYGGRTPGRNWCGFQEVFHFCSNRFLFCSKMRTDSLLGSLAKEPLPKWW